MRVLVTGGAGFIGSHVCDKLIERGDEVICFDRVDGGIGNIQHLANNQRFAFYGGDVRFFDNILQVVSRLQPDKIIHLAALAGVRPSIKDPWSYYEVNVRGTLNVLESARVNKIKTVVFASSSSVYGNHHGICKERQKTDSPISQYASTKKEGELLCNTYSHLYKMNTPCLRFFTVYGERGRLDMAVRKFTEAIFNEEPVTIYGDGSMMRDYTHVDDIVNGILGSMDNVKGFDTFNLGCGQSVSLNTLVHTISKYVGKKPCITHLPKPDVDVDMTYCDYTKAKKAFGYEPKIKIEEGIERFVQWCIDNGVYRNT